MKTVAFLGTLSIVFSATMAAAQDFPLPQKEHKWLEQFVGEWEADMETVAQPDQPAMKCKGEMTYRMLGGFWVICDSTVNMSGIHINAVQTIGYDPEKKKYVGTWVDSMSSHMWKYEGTVDQSGKKLDLEAEGPNFMQPGKMANFRDSYEFKSKDHIYMTSAMQGEDGEWTVFMKADMRRKE